MATSTYVESSHHQLAVGRRTFRPPCEVRSCILAVATGKRRSMSIRHAILGVLTARPMHGYQIGGELARRIGGGRYNSAQIYQSLHWLADHGMVLAGPPEPGVSRDRRPFQITPAGRREFQKWLRAPLVPSRPVRDDAVVKLVFLGMHDARQLLTFLERLRRQHLRRLTTPVRRGQDGSDGTHVDEPLLADLSTAALR